MLNFGILRTQILFDMNNTTSYKVALVCAIALFCYPLSAQNLKNFNSGTSTTYEIAKREKNYTKLLSLGYSGKEIFEDLGNANFLNKNYETALFWYKQLMNSSKNGILSNKYYDRYQYAFAKTGAVVVTSSSLDNKDWLASIESDYQVNKRSSNATTNRRHKEWDLRLNTKSQSLGHMVQYGKSKDNQGKSSSIIEKFDDQNLYKAPIAVTADGNTAYYSKAVYVKPLYGLFSKKELVHKIYKADKIDGEWKKIKEIALCPKNYNTLHPSVSSDGKRLFFASDMPGTFGKYDIYVATVHKDGTFGVAKNLGEKVNTRDNDLYPKIVGGNTLVFASEGRKGYGGLDVYMTEVGRKKVSLAVNLGRTINSIEDDFSIFLMNGKSKGYVMSNRGKDKDAIHKVAFSYAARKKDKSEEKRDYNILEAFNTDVKIDYTSSTFEDE